MLLSGCAAPTVAARVTSFQQWPAGVEGQSYQFVPADASQTNNLEYQSFQDMVRAGIGATGLVEAQAGAKPRFDVSFTYGTSQTQVMVRRPYDPGFYGGYGYGHGGITVRVLGAAVSVTGARIGWTCPWSCSATP